MKNNLLFSAPFSFLGNTKNKFNELIQTDFREIWTSGELGDVRYTRYWIPNPGQAFSINKKILDKFECLKMIITPSTGKNHINLDDCLERGIKVKGLLDNLHTLRTIRASSEFTFLMLLNGLRRMDYAINEVRNLRWRHNEDLMRGNELIGKKIGIIGLGRNGSNIAKWSQSFDAIVSFYDPYVENESYEKYQTLDDLFEISDIIVICCTLNELTYQMIGKKLLKKTKKNALLVNSSRGELIIEDDLKDILEIRKDIRVSLDVLSNEVKAKQFSSPLMKFIESGRIIVTPHIAGATYESQNKAAIGAFELLKEHIEKNE